MSEKNKKKCSCKSLLIFLILLVMGIWLVPSLGAQAVRIMPLGDSITGSPGCWRALLYLDLIDNGYTNIDFVGTLPDPGCGVTYDGDNEGHGGYLATEIVANNQLPGWLSATNPDIVMMFLGTNDTWSSKGTSVILNAFTTLVGQMRANNPNMKILVAQLPPNNYSGCTQCTPNIIDLNAAIPSWAAGLYTSQSPVYVVDQFTGFNTDTDTTDGCHPNDSGNEKIAANWFPALAAYLDGAVPTPVPTSVPTATPNPTPDDNIAMNRPVTVSSVEDSNFSGEKAVDGDSSTRWASVPQSDPQWIYVDLGSSTDISRVILYWEAAYATQYKIQVSNDANTWTDLVTDYNGDGGTDDLSVSGTGRYVRMYGMAHNNWDWGYSLWEFAVYGSSSGETPAPTTPIVTLGDVNSDGSIDIVDALLIAQYYVGLNPSNFNINAADTNCNGSVDIVDALLIAQYYVGLITGFC